MQIVTGDDIEIEVTLTKNKSRFLIGDAAIIKAAVTDANKILVGPVPVVPSILGSDWGHSKVIVTMTGKMTSALVNVRQAKLEIQVEDEGRKVTWFAPVTVVIGMIK